MTLLEAKSHLPPAELVLGQILLRDLYWGCSKTPVFGQCQPRFVAPSSSKICKGDIGEVFGHEHGKGEQFAN